MLTYLRDGKLLPVTVMAILVPTAVESFTPFWAAVPAMLLAASGQPYQQAQNHRGNQGHPP
jgi:hypothetical protein